MLTLGVQFVFPQISHLGMALDSRAAFKERALEVGISSDDVTALSTEESLHSRSLLSVVLTSLAPRVMDLCLIIWRLCWVLVHHEQTHQLIVECSLSVMLWL